MWGGTDEHWTGWDTRHLGRARRGPRCRTGSGGALCPPGRNPPGAIAITMRLIPQSLPLAACGITLLLGPWPLSTRGACPAATCRLPFLAFRPPTWALLPAPLMTLSASDAPFTSPALVLAYFNQGACNGPLLYGLLPPPPPHSMWGSPSFISLLVTGTGSLTLVALLQGGWFWHPRFPASRQESLL